MGTVAKYSADLAAAKDPIELTITSADEAWSWLEAALRNQPIPPIGEMKFEGWPKLTFNVKGRDWDSSVPARIMGPLLEYHRDLQRAYANVRYGAPASQRLRDDERDQLELVVKVGQGSSDFVAELAKQFAIFAAEAGKKMSSTQLVVLVLGLALTFTAPELYKQYVAKRQAETDAVKTVQLSQEETKRAEILADAFKAASELMTAKNDRLETENRILKAMRPADRISNGGIELTGEQARQITKPERALAQAVTISGFYRILRVDTDRGAGFRIKVEEFTSAETLTAEVPIELPAKQRDVVSAAEWKKEIVWLAIDAERHRDSIRDATITSARKPTEAELLELIGEQ